ncbi:hypothetical protein HanRHA438_Chr16g0776321 [Helianthus annuus]|nr:hypothetical protein HanRHA438_Chr16g0776321 [Helianthus annuus]
MSHLSAMKINREILVRPVYKPAYASMSSCSPLMIGFRCCCSDKGSSSVSMIALVRRVLGSRRGFDSKKIAEDFTELKTTPFECY